MGDGCGGVGVWGRERVGAWGRGGRLCARAPHSRAPRGTQAGVARFRSAVRARTP